MFFLPKQDSNITGGQEKHKKAIQLSTIQNRNRNFNFELELELRFRADNGR